MPLNRLFRSARKSRRSGSSNSSQRNPNRNNELSIVSLDESNLRVAASCIDVQQPDDTDTFSVKKPHPTHPVQWNSASSLIPSRESQIKNPAHNHLIPSASKSLGPESPRRRLCFTKSAAYQTQDNDKDTPTLSRKQSHSTVRKKLSHFDDLSRLEFSADGYRLTSQQRDLLKLCWLEANRRQGELGRFVFNWVFAKYPELKKVFRIDDWEIDSREVRFQKHIQAFTDVLELVVGSVVDEADDGLGSAGTLAGLSLDDTTGPLLHSYGAKHVQIENRLKCDNDLIQPEYWDIFRTAMCEYASSAWRTNVLSALSASAQKRNEALHAWRIMVYYVIAKIRRGYEIEKIEQKKRGRGRSVAE